MPAYQLARWTGTLDEHARPLQGAPSENGPQRPRSTRHQVSPLRHYSRLRCQIRLHRCFNGQQAPGSPCPEVSPVNLERWLSIESKACRWCKVRKRRQSHCHSKWLANSHEPNTNLRDFRQLHWCCSSRYWNANGKCRNCWVPWGS